MATHEDSKEDCFLISIESTSNDGLFDCYRDYLVFMSLVRDGVRSCQYKVHGFCWIKNQCLMLIQPETENVGDFLLKLLKRYHFWLLQKGPKITEFKLQMLELAEESWLLDGLRFIHQSAVKSKIVEDAMDYHWHSHHAYNGFWSVNWLDKDFILNKFAGNRLCAMNLFRQYMQHPHRLDFNALLSKMDCSSRFISQSIEDTSQKNKRAVAEINSQYHQSLLDRTLISFSSRNGAQYILITVLEEDLLN